MEADLSKKVQIMTLDYTICPHCGCRCEDDEYCAACGKLFHEDTVPAHTFSLRRLMGSGLRSSLKKTAKDSRKEGWHTHSPENYPYSLDQDSDLDVDSSWAILSTNIHNRNR